MTLLIIIMIAIGVMLYYVKEKIDELARSINHKVQIITDKVTHPGDLVADMGVAVATSAIKRVKKIIARG